MMDYITLEDMQVNLPLMMDDIVGSVAQKARVMFVVGVSSWVSISIVINHLVLHTVNISKQRQTFHQRHIRGKSNFPEWFAVL